MGLFCNGNLLARLYDSLIQVAVLVQVVKLRNSLLGYAKHEVIKID